ncbi:hypothetical protein ACNVED_06110 [Legionella sp. D16C41]|uniref:hypothetical protein n=1 Tax=Legionella sp. D16C41 TaxID=3402688 RepID=UPI003AF8DE11
MKAVSQRFRSNIDNDNSNLTKPAGTLLEELNNQFLTQHHEAAQAKEKKLTHVIVNLCGKLSLWVKQDNGFIKKDEATIPSPEGSYTRLKQISHIPVLIAEYVKEFNAGIIDMTEFKKRMTDIHNCLSLILKDLPTIFTAENIENQSQILIETQNLILTFIKDENLKHTSQQLKVYLATIKHLLDKNIDLGGEAIINELDEQIDKWNLKNSPQLMFTRALIVGPHGPRDGEPMTQYFESLFSKFNLSVNDNDMQNRSVYYVETLPQLMSKIDIKEDLIEGFLLGSEFNKSIGKKFFSNPNTLFRDLLKHAAHKSIEQKLDSLACIPR